MRKTVENRQRKDTNGGGGDSTDGKYYTWGRRKQLGYAHAKPLQRSSNVSGPIKLIPLCIVPYHVSRFVQKTRERKFTWWLLNSRRISRP